MIKRMFLKKAVDLFEFQDVNLSLISSEKIAGDVYIAAVKDIIPIAIKHGCLITFRPSAKPNRFDFEIILDLPF